MTEDDHITNEELLHSREAQIKYLQDFFNVYDISVTNSHLTGNSSLLYVYDIGKSEPKFIAKGRFKVVPFTYTEGSGWNCKVFRKKSVQFILEVDEEEKPKEKPKKRKSFFGFL